MSVEISYAKEDDIPGIMNVFNELSVSNSKFKLGSYQRGFLVYEPERQDLNKRVKDDSSIILVAKDNDQVVGYALAYDMKDWRKDNPNWGYNLEIDNEENSIFFKHIGRLQGYKKLGLRMEEKAEEIAKSKGYTKVYADISEGNQLSQEVHKKRGYQKIADEKKEDGTNWGIYQKDLNRLQMAQSYENNR